MTAPPEPEASEGELRRVTLEEAELTRELREAERALTVERASRRPAAPLFGPAASVILAFLFVSFASLAFRCTR
jgi:hypothetical protein